MADENGQGPQGGEPEEAEDPVEIIKELIDNRVNEAMDVLRAKIEEELAGIEARLEEALRQGALSAEQDLLAKYTGG